MTSFQIKMKLLNAVKKKRNSKRYVHVIQIIRTVNKKANENVIHNKIHISIGRWTKIIGIPQTMNLSYLGNKWRMKTRTIDIFRELNHEDHFQVKPTLVLINLLQELRYKFELIGLYTFMKTDQTSSSELNTCLSLARHPTRTADGTKSYSLTSESVSYTHLTLPTIYSV